MPWGWLYNQPLIVINVQDALVPCFASFSLIVWRAGKETMKSSPGSVVIGINRESANRERLSKKLFRGVHRRQSMEQCAQHDLSVSSTPTWNVNLKTFLKLLASMKSWSLLKLSCSAYCLSPSFCDEYYPANMWLLCSSGFLFNGSSMDSFLSVSSAQKPFCGKVLSLEIIAMGQISLAE